MNTAIINDIKYAAIVTPTEGIYVIQVSDTVERVTADESIYFQNLRVYPAKAVADGVLTANTDGDVYIGRSTTYLPDKRATTDVDYPVIYELPGGTRMKLSTLCVKGKAGDGVFYSYT